MKYTYAYKTSDGTRHEASIEAKCREDVFVELRKQGIKAIKVVAADGSKANGELRGVRKRAVSGLVALVALGVGALAFVEGTRSGADVAANSANSAPRHQIYGDPVLMENLERGRFDNVLLREGDRMLAWFAEPGRVICPKGTDPRRLTPSQLDLLASYAKSALDAEQDLDVSSETQREIQELKQIVNGLRVEFREYLANGNGTPRSYWRRLIERTVQEAQIYERTRRELEKETNAEVWEQKNESLRRLGLRTIPNPKDAN